MDDRFCEALNQLKDQDIFLYPDPDVLDFNSSKRPAKLCVHSKSVFLDVSFGDDLKKAREYLGAMQYFLGGEHSILTTWNLKEFLTYVRGKTGVDFTFKGKIYDISFLQSYLGMAASRPKGFAEARQNLLKITKKFDWEKVNSVYQEVHLPLILSIPRIETYGLSHKSKKSKVYPHYEIDGQANGRMKCSNISARSYNPHTLPVEEKANLCCPGFDYTFMYFDFKHMEVNMLQWLSKDEDMGKILRSGQDFYKAVWEILTNSSCNAERRQICKNFFLPVFYGLGSEALASKLNWPLDSSKGLISRMCKRFPVAWAWMKTQQQSMGSDGTALDYFGRRRVFDNSYKIRNFVVQSPASLVCLHKLVLLMAVLKDIASVCMHIHDGYVLSVAKDNVSKAYQIAKQILESENELYPGLKLSVGCEQGVSLNEMVSYGN